MYGHRGIGYRQIEQSSGIKAVNAVAQSIAAGTASMVFFRACRYNNLIISYFQVYEFNFWKGKNRF
jgi:hypothetical protein